MKEHLVIIRDLNGKVEPKLYSCGITEKTKEQAVQAAKKAYELKFKIFDYEATHFEHSAPCAGVVPNAH